MCGISGKVVFGGSGQVIPREIQLLNERLKHRGPDGEGIYINAKGNIGLGHRRLAIIDLSAAAQQPMSNEDGTVWLVFNGEIYNFKELRPELEKKGHQFKSQSDSEVIIHLYEDYGENCLKYLRGMFALAIWDEKKQQLFLARDRLGKKPLKYYLGDGFLIFASELKAILADKEVKPEIDEDSLASFFSFNHVASPRTGFKGILKLPPAHYALLRNGQLILKRYWDLDFSKKIKISYQEAKEELARLLREAVQLRLVADVPLGAFLSGGIDSSIVVALMSEAGRPKTFSIGFAEEKFDERPFARLVAEKFNTDHTEFEVKADAVAILPKLVKQYEEPYADSSALPSYYLAELTRQQVKVALNGDGGDEAFGGYRRFLFWNLARYFKKDLYDYLERRHYFRSGIRSRGLVIRRPEKLDDVLALSYQTFLPDDLLVKMDMATMAFALEARSPFLDQKLVEFVASLPARWKISGLKSKIILKETFSELLPKKILQRGKYGFVLPLDNWFRGRLYSWSRDTLLSQSAVSHRYFEKKDIERLLKEHYSGQANHGQRIWLLLCLEYWLKSFNEKENFSPNTVL